MMNKNNRYKIIFLSFVVLVSTLFANSRVAFSRPNSIYRTPGSYFPDLGEGKISLGFSTEIIDLEVPSNSTSVFINTKIKKWNVGFSHTSLPDYRSIEYINYPAGEVEGGGPLEQTPSETAVHLQRRIYGYKDLYIDCGIHDISIKNYNSDAGLFDDASLFMVIANRKKFGKYEMTINYGFGTGKIGSDYHNYDDSSGPSMSPFLSLFLNTPFFKNKMNLMFEYDGSGINLGTQIPITDIYSVRFGVSHINAITDWARRSNQETPEDLLVRLGNEDPTIMFGFIMNIPDIKSDQERLKNKLLDPEGNGKYDDFRPLVIIDSSKIKEQEIIIANYRDSLLLFESKVNILNNENAKFKKNIAILEDSTKKVLLDIEIDKSKQNVAMRNFQSSHDLLVEEKYEDALEAINRVIELQPNLAIAYARRGTIYYYLNDLKSASMNWNIALKIDPEYDQVRNILQSLKEGSLEPLYKNNKEEK